MTRTRFQHPYDQIHLEFDLSPSLCVDDCIASVSGKALLRPIRLRIVGARCWTGRSYNSSTSVSNPDRIHIVAWGGILAAVGPPRMSTANFGLKQLPRHHLQRLPLFRVSN